MKCPRIAWRILLVFVVVFGFGIVAVSSAQAAFIPDGQIVGVCVGWPTPHIEVRWSVNPPPGSLQPNSNSVLRDVNGTGNQWFFGGGTPGVYATRIDGSVAVPYGAGGYPNPNYTVYDLRDDSVTANVTYTYKAKYRPETPSSNVYAVTVNATNCGPPATPTPSPTPTPPAIADGRIDGYCSWSAGAPQVHLLWSQNPPPGQGIANSNQLQKGDCYPGDPGSYWCALANSPTHYSFTDTAVPADTQYQYRVKYRPDLASLNTYNIFTSATNCGVLPPTPGPLTVSPNFQTVPPNVTALLTATGGAGSYIWSAPAGTISGTGSQVGVLFTNSQTSAVYKTVTVQSGTQIAIATVQVDGVLTYRDDIGLLGRGTRYVLIDDDAPMASSSDVLLTLSHGFANEATVSMTVKLGNTAESAVAAIEQPFQKNVPWNLCADPSACGDGMYTVYAMYRTPSGSSSPMVQDSIVYLKSIQGEPSVTINGGALSTANRKVTLTLTSGLKGIPADEITMQVANRAELLDSAKGILYGPSLADWDVCTGLGSTCTNDTKTVYAKFCARGVCTTMTQDDILLQSPWPDWGASINDNAVSTDTSAVTLKLNPWFNKPGTEVFLSNLPDFSVLSTSSFKESVPWNVCAGLASCTPENYSVFVRYINHNKSSLWPGTVSPDYQDNITLSGPTCVPRPPCLDLTPACKPPEPQGGWCPAPASTAGSVLINSGALRTTSRFVWLSLVSPFGSDPASVRARVINEQALTERDRGIIEKRGGGIESQPRGPRAPTPLPTQGTPNARTLQALVADVIPELESGSTHPFTSKVTGWDLCDGASQCPFGVYKVYVQYTKIVTAGAFSGVSALLGDEMSDVYFDDISYGAPTPTPTPTPTGSITPTPGIDMEPSVTPGVGPSGVPGGSPPPSVFIQTISEASGVIAPISVASAVAVGTSAVVALAPILGSSGAAAFMWQGLTGMLGLLPKRKKVWGTVYDANTKRPIPFAKVQLMDRSKRVLETHIADKDGRYGFLTTPESLLAQNVQISIAPSAKGYLFPAHTAASVDTFVYNNLYYGDLITVSDQKLINFDIPMDPRRPSVTPLALKSPSIVLGASVAAIADAGFWLGLIMIPLNVILAPNPFSFGVLFLFLGTASLRIWGIQEHPFGIVRDAQTGRPMSFALITLNDLSGKRVGFTVTDEQGRYFLVADRGTYEMTMFTPATVIPTRQTKQIIEARKGWITREIRL